MSYANRLFQYSCVFSVLAGLTTLAFAVGGTITFSGVITEPMCNVQNQVINLRTLSKAGNGNQIPLNVRCNANQSVQISILDVDSSSNAKTFSGGVAGAEITIRHNAKLLTPGEKFNYSFTGKQDAVVPLTATLRHAANADAPQHGSILVSFDYR